jgi:thiol:disulfide interchange protein
MTDMPPAGWYPDPEDASQQRYWDGSTWTEHRAPGVAAQPTQPTYAPTNTQGYDQGQAAWSQQQPDTSGSAIAALVLGILSIVACLGPFTGIPAMIVGRRASRDIETSDGRLEGSGLATAGFVTGLIGTLLGVLAILAIVGLFAVASSSSDGY